MLGTRDVSEALAAGFLFEVQYRSNPSDAVSFSERSISAEFAERHIDLFLKGDFGIIAL